VAAGGTLEAVGVQIDAPDSAGIAVLVMSRGIADLRVPRVAIRVLVVAVVASTVVGVVAVSIAIRLGTTWRRAGVGAFVTRGSGAAWARRGHAATRVGLGRSRLAALGAVAVEPVVTVAVRFAGHDGRIRSCVWSPAAVRRLW